MLSARPRQGGGRQISLLMLPGSLGELELRDAIERGTWLRLMPDLRGVTWRFYNEQQQDWVEEWPEGAGRPPLVELNLELLGEDVPRKYVFWLPPVKEMQEAPPSGEQPSPEPEPEPEPVEP